MYPRAATPLSLERAFFGWIGGLIHRSKFDLAQRGAGLPARDAQGCTPSPTPAASEVIVPPLRWISLWFEAQGLVGVVERAATLLIVPAAVPLVVRQPVKTVTPVAGYAPYATTAAPLSTTTATVVHTSRKRLPCTLLRKKRMARLPLS